jgi:hypothetical protein
MREKTEALEARILQLYDIRGQYKGGESPRCHGMNERQPYTQALMEFPRKRLNDMNNLICPKVKAHTMKYYSLRVFITQFGLCYAFQHRKKLRFFTNQVISEFVFANESTAKVLGQCGVVDDYIDT